MKRFLVFLVLLMGIGGACYAEFASTWSERSYDSGLDCNYTWGNNNKCGGDIRIIYNPDYHWKACEGVFSKDHDFHYTAPHSYYLNDDGQMACSGCEFVRKESDGYSYNIL